MDDSKVNCLLWLFLTMVVPSTCFQTDVGVLLMTDNFLPFDMPRIAPAIDMGRKDAEKVFNISFKLILSNYSTDCNGAWTESVGKMAELFYHRNVKVFLGPACSQGVASAGLLAEYIGVPLVTGVGDLLERSPIEKKGYETTTILSYSIDKMSGEKCVFRCLLLNVSSCVEIVLIIVCLVKLHCTYHFFFKAFLRTITKMFSN